MTSPEMRQDSPSNQPFGAQVLIVNQLSTPALLILMLVALVLGLGVGYAVARSNEAIDRAALAEREGRLAEEAAMHLRSTMRAYGISINQTGIRHFVVLIQSNRPSCRSAGSYRPTSHAAQRRTRGGSAGTGA